MKVLIYCSIILLGFASCMKDEIPITKHEAGNVIANQIELGTNYRYQAYYDFGTNSFVQKHLKTEWDFGFETGPAGVRIVLNTSKSMAIAEYPMSDLSSTTDTIGAEWRYDVTSGNLDSTAIRNWQTGNSFYLVNRGYSFDGIHQGFRKIQLLSVDADKYEMLFSGLDGSNQQIAIIEKDNSFNFSFFSFSTNDIVTIEPQKEDWDLVFGQYAHLFDPTFPYLVTGVLSNRNGVEVAEVFDMAFEDIAFVNILDYSFSQDIDIIGYDWKTFIGGAYTTNVDQNYIVKTTEGAYYKIHFTDFYSAQGDKGNPQFEVSAL